MISLLIPTLLLLSLSAPPCCTAFSLNQPSNKNAATTLRMGLFGGDSGNLKDLFQPKPDGPTTVLEIPVENVKPRPLRFFLQIYIVGQQNSKDAQSWLPKETGENELEVYFKDGTGMCNIALGDTSIKIQRHGQRPSLQYLLQESLMLHGVLDELNEIAFEVEDVEDSQRLLMLDKGALDDARAKLPARQD